MRHQSLSSWALISISIAAVVHFALGFAIEFSVDEAHYALYAQHLALSYFDHPPLVGWIQWPLVSLSNSEGVIRLIPELLWILSAYLVYQVALEIHHFMQGRNAGYLTSALRFWQLQWRHFLMFWPLVYCQTHFLRLSV